MHMPTPSTGHKKFELMAGTWEGTETMYPSPWDPKGGTAVGRTESRIAVGGFGLVIDYRQMRGDAVTFTGHGIYTFDPKSELYAMTWIDSMGSPPEHFTGAFIDDVLVLGHGGPPMHVRMRSDYTQPNQIASSMEMSEDGRSWKKLFDGAYHRVR
ncbi:MAG: DUF1579 domain-containing protein [Gemmatimonadales bacterium]|jgi:hypothetical protein|nr:MAG: DUF1579 domain-containing protein [Gemmatimonadales bacterium]